MPCKKVGQPNKYKSEKTTTATERSQKFRRKSEATDEQQEEPKKIGRPVKSNKMTGAERNRRYREKQEVRKREWEKEKEKMLKLKESEGGQASVVKNSTM